MVYVAVAFCDVMAADEHYLHPSSQVSPSLLHFMLYFYTHTDLRCLLLRLFLQVNLHS